MSDEVRGAIEQFWETMGTNDFKAVGDLFHDDFVLEWPQTDERIRGRDNFAAVNTNYPAAGRWRFTINRLVADEDSGVSDVTVTDGVRVDRAISFFQLHDGKIWRVTEYWPENDVAPEWRSQWVERGGNPSQ
ncbi:MAG TPA: nuclear transport factor 2 family protein [Chloroflexota bacterium]|nr:nuclear transport factor 2 family protein [Chloroflexota bacterium]